MPTGTHIDSFPGEVEVTGKISATGGANKIEVTEDAGTNATFYPIISDSNTGGSKLKTHTNITFNPATNLLSTRIATAQHANSVDVSTNADNAQQGQYSQVAQSVSLASHAHFADNCTYANHAYNCGYAQIVQQSTYSGNTNYAGFAGDCGYAQNSNHSYGAIYSSNWFRPQGTAGFYFESYHGGWQMSNYQNQDIYNNKKLHGFAGWRVYGIIPGQAYVDFADHQHDWWTNGGNMQADTGWVHYGVMIGYAIRAPGYSSLSDRRAKKNIEDLDDVEALETVRALKPCKYDYKANFRKTQKKQIGFIAQEVMEVLPEAVDIDTDSIPNIQSNATVTNTGNVFCFTQYDHINKDDTGYCANVECQCCIFELVLDNEPTEVVIEEGTKLHLAYPENTRTIANVLSVINSKTYEIHVEESEDPFKERCCEGSANVHVFGTLIDDFHVLDKDKIWAVSTAALQQIDREHQIEKQKVSNAESQLSSILSRLQALEDAAV